MIPIEHCQHHWLLRAPWPCHSPQQVNNLWWQWLLVAYLIPCLPLFLINRLPGNMPRWKTTFSNSWPKRWSKVGSPWMGQHENSFCCSPSSFLLLANGMVGATAATSVCWGWKPHVKDWRTKDRRAWVPNDNRQPLYQNWVAFSR